MQLHKIKGENKLEVGREISILDRPIITSSFKNDIIVYTHWLNGKCFYVGSGLIKRAFERYEYQRNNNWFEIVGDNLDKVVVIIEKYFESRDEAYKYEKELTLDKISTGETLANKYYGHSMNEESRLSMISSLKGKMSGDKNPFYGKVHTQESIDKMVEKKSSYRGKNHFRHGKPLTDEHKKRLSSSRTGKRDLIEAIYPDGSHKTFEGYNKAGKEARCDPAKIRSEVKKNGYFKHPRTQIEYKMIIRGENRNE